MIKGGKAGDTNKLYLTLHEADCLRPQASRPLQGQKTGAFYRVKNRKQGNNYRTQSWLGIRGLADWMYCVSGQEEHLKGNENHLRFSLLMRHPGRRWLHLGPRKLFQHKSCTSHV